MQNCYRNQGIIGLLLVCVAAPGAAQTVASAAPAQQPLKPYRINAGDELEIYVWGEARLQRVLRVLPDGTFSFPLVGRVEAAGKLPGQIEALVTQGLSAQYRGQVPQVTVAVRLPSGLQFSVLGRVKTPGTFTPGRYVNIIEALSYAGGTDEFANLDRVTIIRKRGESHVTVSFKLGAVLSARREGRDLGESDIPQIESGDTVIVP